jgi:hypothetical protein
MNPIQTAYINALLADAGYVKEISRGEINTAVFKPRLTEPQALFLANNFAVLDSYDAPSYKPGSGLLLLDSI